MPFTGEDITHFEKWLVCVLLSPDSDRTLGCVTPGGHMSLNAHDVVGLLGSSMS